MLENRWADPPCRRGLPLEESETFLVTGGAQGDSEVASNLRDQYLTIL